MAKFKWDVPKGLEIEYFDPALSYELTGYRPINQTEGLDFKPEWFTEARDNYKRTGHYCSYRFKSKPYNDFWQEENRRCKEGFSSHGYTITGDNYFFLNYYTLPVVSIGLKSGSGTRDDFPIFFASLYAFFHYFEMAKRLHLHAALMKARSIGFSEINASIATNMFVNVRLSDTLITCYDELKLKRTYKKFTHALMFLDGKTDGGMFRLRQIEDSALCKRSGFYRNINGQKVADGFQSSVTGVIGKDPGNIRGDRVDLLVYDEAGCHAPGTLVIMADGRLKNVEDILVGDKVMGDDGTPRTVVQLHSGELQMYRIIPKNGDELIVNENHILYGKRRTYYNKKYTEFEMKVKDYYDMVSKQPRKKDGYKLIRSSSVHFKHKNVPLDPYILGYWLGDGDSAKARFTSEDLEVINYLIQFGKLNNFDVRITDCKNAKKCKHIYLADNRPKNRFHDILRQLGVFNNKSIPDIYLYNDDNILLQVLAGIIDSDGTYNHTKKVVEITQYEGRKHLIDLIEFICHVLGMRVSRDSRLSKERIMNGRKIKGGVRLYRIRILYGHSKIPTKILRKQSVDRDGKIKKSNYDRLDTTFKIEKLNIGKYYGFTLDGNQLFLLKDFTICHNSWPGLTTAIVQGLELVEVQGVPRGIMLFGGTGGDHGMALEGLRTIYYEPKAFKILPYHHNYTETHEYVTTGYFIPYFALSLNPEYMDERGVCKEKEFKELLQKERDALAALPDKYVEKCAERCWTAEEAFNMEGDNKFNKGNIVELLTRIRALKECPPIKTGWLEYTYRNGEHTENNITGFKWIDNPNGKIKILEDPIWLLPLKKDENGKVIWSPPEEPVRNLYVIGIDGIDIGKLQTSESTKDPSDFCLVVKKRTFGLLEPLYVAIYKDRPNDIREAYKITRKIAEYYNATINIEATRQGIIPYAKSNGFIWRFMRRPRATLAETARNTNKLFGTPATPAIIDHQTDLIRDYIEDYCHLIWFEEMLDEANRYTIENKRKFDIIASMGMAELADEELQGVVPYKMEDITKGWRQIGYYTDEFGRRRYGEIPNLNNNNNIRWNNNFGDTYEDPGRIRTSNPRYYQGYLSQGIHW